MKTQKRNEQSTLRHINSFSFTLHNGSFVFCIQGLHIVYSFAAFIKQRLHPQWQQQSG